MARIPRPDAVVEVDVSFGDAKSGKPDAAASFMRRSRKGAESGPRSGKKGGSEGSERSP